MDAAEAADAITEEVEEHHAHAPHEGFRSHAALVIAILAAILAVCELGGDNAKNTMIYNNIKASDSWSFYQAKTQRQTAFKLAGDDVKRRLADPGLSAPARALLQADLERYDKTVARYESEPDAAAPNDPLRGEGKKQLQARAKSYEEARQVANERNESFDYAKMALQLAIVLGSVSILAQSRPLLLTAGVMGAAGLALLANGFWFLLPLPI